MNLYLAWRKVCVCCLVFNFGKCLTMHKMKKILVVDDESDICLTLANVLEDNRFVVHKFDDPLLALKNFRKE